jgi:hypothetical protein
MVVGRSPLDAANRMQPREAKLKRAGRAAQRIALGSMASSLSSKLLVEPA